MTSSGNCGNCLRFITAPTTCSQLGCRWESHPVDSAGSDASRREEGTLTIGRVGILSPLRPELFVAEDQHDGWHNQKAHNSQ